MSARITVIDSIVAEVREPLWRRLSAAAGILFINAVLHWMGWAGEIWQKPFLFQIMFGVFTVIGIALIYPMCNMLFSRTLITMHGGLLVIRERPFPMTGKIELQCPEIDQFFIDETVRKGRKHRVTTHDVFAKISGGESVNIAWFRRHENAEHLRHILCAWLFDSEKPPMPFRCTRG